MEQIQVSKQESQIETPQIEQPQVEQFRYLGDMFAEYLETKGRRDEFDKLKNLIMVSVDGEILHKVVDGKKVILGLADALLTKILPSQKVRFLPKVAGG